MKKSLSVGTVLCLLIAILLSGCSNNGEKSEGKENGKNLKVAFLYDSPVGDGGWITSHDLGRKAVEEMDGVDTTYVDNISESEGWSYMNNFAKENYDLIFACSFGYMQDCVDVSEKNPETVFMHCAGYMTTDNMGNYFGKNFEASYLAGMACAGVSKSGIIAVSYTHLPGYRGNIMVRY